MPKCLYCDVDYIAGALYCDSCGRRLPQPTGTPTKHVTLPPDPPPRSPNGGDPAAPDAAEPDKPQHLRLQVIQAGVIFDLGERESIIIGRTDPDQQPDVDLAPYGGVEKGVGRRHALIIRKQGRYYIEDLKSLNETMLNASRLAPGQRYLLNDGDQLQFGYLPVKVLL